MPALTLPIPPGANRIWRTYRGVTVKSKEARAFAQTVRKKAMQAGLCAPYDGPIMVAMVYLPRARKKETPAPLRRLDVDAVIKPTLDALIGIAYADDYQVVAVSSRLGKPVQNGALVVTWEAM